MTIMMYPGSFDPYTCGHLDITLKASAICDELHVVVLSNPYKKADFSLNERVGMIQKATAHIKNVKVVGFEGRLIDYYMQSNAVASIRGLRSNKDFEFEMTQEIGNTCLCKSYQVIYLTSNLMYRYLSSSLVKEIVRFGGTISKLVPNENEEQIVSRLSGLSKLER